MILNNINQNLIKLGFHRIGVNKDNIYLFNYTQEQKVYVVAVIDCPSGNEYDSGQLESIKQQIYNYFLNKDYSVVNLLGIISTANPDKVRGLAKGDNNMWIVDTVYRRLIIYENQREDFLGLRKMIEDILAVPTYDMPRSRSNNTYPDYINKKTTKNILSQYMSKWNTVLLILNVLVYFLVNYISIVKDYKSFMWSGALYWPAIMYFNEYYRLFTYMFLHSSMEHLANNMIVLFFIGDNLERAAGSLRFLIIYFGSGFVAGLISMSYNMLKGVNVVSVGASGAIFGVVGAMAYIVIVNKGRLENISTRQMILFVMFSLYGGLTSQGVDNAAHIGGLIAGFILAAIFYRKQKNSNRRRL